MVLCTGNSCRSQMAHGYLETLQPEPLARIYSAGIETHGLNPDAVRIMAEDGVDISGHTSNHVDEYAGIAWDYIITVCDHAREHCPYIAAPGARRLHHNFADPSRVAGSPEVRHQAFVKTRDAIKAYCKAFVEEELQG